MPNNLPPGKLGLPLMGETIDFLKDRNFAAKRHQRYGDIFKTNTAVCNQIEDNKAL
jgi:hypothetical protein